MARMPLDPAALSEALERAGRDLEETSGIGSASSEDRDDVQAAMSQMDKLERLSNCSGSGSVSSQPSRSSGGTQNANSLHRDAYPRVLQQREPSSGRRKHGGDRRASAGGGEGDAGADTAAFARSPKPASGSQEGSHEGKAASAPRSVASEGSSLPAASTGAHQATAVSSTSGGSGSSACNPLPGLTTEQQEAVDAMVADLKASHGEEIERLFGMLQLAQLSEASHARENSELEVQVASQLKKIAANADLQERLDTSKKGRIQADQERDDLKDKIAGMLAVQKARDVRHNEDLTDLKTRNAEDARRQELDSQKKELDSEKKKQVLKEELATVEAQLLTSTARNAELFSERDTARRRELNADAKHAGNVAHMEAKLSALGREIARRDELKLAREKGKGVWQASDFQEQRRLEKLLGDSRDKNHELNSELADLRLEMMTMQHTKRDVPESPAPPTLKAKSAMAPRAHARRPPNMLSSIDEGMDDDDDDRGSSSFSANVSSSGSFGGEADLSDFDDPGLAPGQEQAVDDDRICELTAELQASWARNRELRDHAIGADAEALSKIVRLKDSLAELKDIELAHEKEVNVLRAAVLEAKEKNNLDEAQASRAVIALKEARDEDRAASAQRARELEVYWTDLLEDVQNRLACAMEAKRLESARLADTKQAMVNMELLHKKAIHDLQMQVKLQQDLDADPSMKSDVLERLAHSEEERNLLRNELEAARVHWQGLLEHEQQLHEASQKSNVRNQELLDKERETNAKLLSRVASLEADLQNMNKASSAREEKMAAKLQEAEARASTWPWRCPIRARAGPVGKATPEGLGASLPFQACVWQILSSLKGLIAVKCSHESLSVKDATRRAFNLWGSSSLRSATLLTLVSVGDGASWLKDEVDYWVQDNSSGNGFLLQELGCLEFKDKTGQIFDAFTMCARLPETGPGSNAALVFILEPLDVAETQMASPALQQMWNRPGPRSATQRSGVARTPSVLSEDITANDSVSNVNANTR